MKTIQMVSLITAGLFSLVTLDLHSTNSDSYKKTSFEQKAREHRRMLKTIGQESCTDACEKIEGINKLLQDLNAETVKDAREALKNIRSQMTETIETEKKSHMAEVRDLTQAHADEIKKIHAHYLDEIQNIKDKTNHFQDAANNVQDLFDVLDVDSIDAALEKIQALQSTIKNLESTIEDAKERVLEIANDL